MSVSKLDTTDVLQWLREREAAAAAERGVTVEEFRAQVAEEKARHEAEEAARAAHKRHLDRVERFAFKMPPDAYQALLHGTLEKTRALEVVSQWLDAKRAFCLLLGGTGVGKTVAAMYAYSLFDSGEFVRSSDLGPAMDPWKGDREVARVRADSKGMFVLDDLGIERSDDARWAVCFDELVDARQGRRTIITSNLTPQQIAERYSERARDRIRASCVVVTLTGKSMRGGK